MVLGKGCVINLTNKYWKRAAAFVAVAGLALTTAACSQDKTVASYKGGKITQQQYYNKMKESQSGKSTLASMIIENTLEQQYGSKVSQKQVNKQYNAAKKQYGSQFEAILQQNGMTASSYKDSIKTQLLSEAALKDIKKVSKKQEEKAYKSYQPKITVEHILVSKKETAQNIINQLNKGASFKTLAAKYSTDTSTKKKSGKLPAFDSTDTSLDSSFKKAAFKLTKVGQITQTPVKSQYGYHVIKLVKKTKKQPLSNPAMKKKIDNQLYNKMMQSQTTMQSVISTVLKKADVSIKDNDLKDVLSQYISSSSSSPSSN